VLVAHCFGIGGDDHRGCDDVLADIDLEVKALQACELDEECGQVMEQTSCGCTRELVARLDADLQRFEELRGESELFQCRLEFISPCDCPEADGFICEDEECAWDVVF